MKAIISDILANMQRAACDIQDKARDAGYTGDPTKAAAVIKHLANSALDTTEYAGLHSASQTIADGYRLIMAHTKDANAQAGAVRLKAFDYNG